MCGRLYRGNDGVGGTGVRGGLDDGDDGEHEVRSLSFLPNHPPTPRKRWGVGRKRTV